MRQSSSRRKAASPLSAPSPKLRWPNGLQDGTAENLANVCLQSTWWDTIGLADLTPCADPQPRAEQNADFNVPRTWEYTAPLIAPEVHKREPSRAQKDPSVVFHEGQWHVFMTVKLPGRSAVRPGSVRFQHSSRASISGFVVSARSFQTTAPSLLPAPKWRLGSASRHGGTQRGVQGPKPRGMPIAEKARVCQTGLGRSLAHHRLEDCADRGSGAISHCMAFSKSYRDFVVEQLEPIAPVTT